MTDKNPALARVTISAPNEHYYELRGAMVLEMGADETDLLDVQVLQGEGPHEVVRDSTPHTYIIPVDGTGSFTSLMRSRFPAERFIVDVCAPMLWEDLPPELNDQKSVEFWKLPESRRNGRECIQLADAVMVHGPHLVELVSDINPNIFVVKDLEREDMKDLARFMSDIGRVMAFASGHPNYSAFAVPKKTGVLSRLRKVFRV